MSFAFMPLYTGDYLRDTRHLTPMRHGVYILLLMHCWDQQGPLPSDEQECAGIANCRSADEIDALRYILKRFFTLCEDGWYNKRIQTEVERAQVISVKRTDAGRRGANARMRKARGTKASAEQLLGKSDASDTTPTPTPTNTPTTTNKPPPTPTIPGKASKSSPPRVPETSAGAQFLPPPRVEPELWEAYLRHRKSKRARLTEDAYKLLKRDLARMEDPNGAIERTIANGWTGVFDRPGARANGIDEWLRQSEKEVQGERE